MVNEKFEALKTADEYLDKLKNGIEKVIDLIEKEHDNKACSYIVDIAGGIDWLIQVVNLTSSIQEEKIDLSNINEKLNEVVEALENEDYNLLGDLFKYEISPLLDRIHKQIRICVLN